jgi:phosphoserine aminotransferase
MNDNAAVELPPSLLPEDGRFGSGPSKVRTEILLELGVTGTSYMGTSHRRPGVRSVVAALRAGLTDLFSLPAGYEVLLGVGGATSFWDAAAVSLIQQRSQHLVFGEFSGKFAAVAKAAPHLEDPQVIESEPGTHPEAVTDPSIDLYGLTHNETSTGVMMPVVRPNGSSGLVAVDATSGAGAMPVDPTQFDVYYFSPQKVFGAEGGLWVALCSPAAIDRIEQLAASDRWIPPTLSLSLALSNSRKDQTYNTPALATLFLLRRQIDVMLELGGLQWAIDRCAESSSLIYGWADSRPFTTPFVTDPAMRSTTVATIDFSDDVDADTVAAVLRANGIVDTESYRKLGRNQLRIAMFPNIEPSDLEKLTEAIDYIVEHL